MTRTSSDPLNMDRKRIFSAPFQRTFLGFGRAKKQSRGTNEPAPVVTNLSGLSSMREAGTPAECHRFCRGREVRYPNHTLPQLIDARPDDRMCHGSRSPLWTPLAGGAAG